MPLKRKEISLLVKQYKRSMSNSGGGFETLWLISVDVSLPRFKFTIPSLVNVMENALYIVKLIANIIN